MGNTFFFQWEVLLMEFLQAHMSDFAVKFASIISAFGEELFMVVVLGFIYWAWDKKIGLKVGMNLMVADLIFPMIKNVALRRRPYMDNEKIKCLKLIDADADAFDLAAQGYSFPSGHSANSMTAFGSVAYFFRNKVTIIIAIIIPLLVGISRFCLGVHYPTDVLCGWAIGLLVIFVMPLLEKQFKNSRKLYYIIFGVSCLGIIFARTNDYYSSLGMTLGLLLGTAFEEKYVNFKNTRNPIAIILRLAGGVGIFFALNTLLKLPFSQEILSQANMLQFAIRFFRYAIILFVEIGIYPFLFGKIIKDKK